MYWPLLFSSSHKELPMQRTKATSMPNSLIYRFFRNLAEYIFLRFYFVRAAQNILFYCTYSAPASISLFPFFTARISNQAFQILIAAYNRPLEPIIACIFSLPSVHFPVFPDMKQCIQGDKACALSNGFLSP